MASIWSAAAGTPTGTHRVPVDTGAAGSPTMYTVQQLADLETSVGVSVNALGSIAVNTAIDLALGGYVSATIGANLTLSFTNPPAGGTEFTLVLTNGGAFTVTWPGSVTWAGATAPTLTASGTDVLHFTSGNGGTNWYGWLEADLALGTTAGTAAEGNDSRLSDDRTASGLRSATTVVSVSAATAPSSGQVLTATASTTATWQTPSGGLTKFTEAESTASPNATVPVASLTANNAATNVDAALRPKGTGAVLADVPDSTATGGNKRGAGAADWQSTRTAATQVASGATSVIAGGDRNTASGGSSAVCGGERNVASGTLSTAAGGQINTASATGATVGGGGTNTASGNYATAAGGSMNTASGTNSWVPGGLQSITRGITGAGVYANGQRAALGDRQTMVLPISCAARTDATATVMTSDAGAASTTNQMVLPNNSSMFFEVDVVAHDSSLKSASWKVQGTIRRGANAASTTIVGTNVTTTFGSDLSGGSPGVTCTADTTNGALSVTFTGIAATTIYPSGHIRTIIAA